MVRINKIVKESFVDGPGRRTVVFFQGCPIHCQGCQNITLWPEESGDFYDEKDLAKKLVFLSREHGNITISGGEPFAQVASLAKLVYFLKKEGAKEIIIYSGYTWEQLMSPLSGVLPWVKTVFDYADILVDGPFRMAEDNPFITYRGSRNQRPIDIAESLCAGQVVTLDWDQPEVVITPSGSILFPVGLTTEMAEIGTVSNTRRCGQTK